MRRLLPMGIGVLFLCAQPARGAHHRPLRQITAIPLPGVRGRIDHLSIDVQGRRLFVSALGNHTLEVIDLRTGKVIKTIAGLSEPQGVLYVPEVNKIFVDSAGDGTCKVYDGASYRLLDTIAFGSDADDIRFDPVSQRVYVGYGDRGHAGIGVIDPVSDQLLARIPLPSHPEAFSLDRSRLFVNVPSARNIIAVVNLKTRSVVRRWPVAGARENFPMAIDRADHRLFVVTRAPARLIVLDTDSGKQLASLPTVGVADDAYFDAKHRLLLISGGEGYLDVIQESDPQHYRRIDRLTTAPGGRTSLLVPEADRFYLAIARRRAHAAEVRVYQVQ